MAAYIPAIIWIISAFVCAFIAKKRGVKITFSRQLFAAFFGPLAIPFVFFAKPEKETET